MGCKPSKEAKSSFKPYTPPKEFRGSLMTERKPPPQTRQRLPEPGQRGPDTDIRGSATSGPSTHRQTGQMYQAYRKNEQERGGPDTDIRSGVTSGPSPHRQAGQMYQAYRKKEQEHAAGEQRRYSWEGHPTERVFTTFEQLAERGIIPKQSLVKK